MPQRASEGNMDRHKKGQAVTEKHREKRGCYPRHILRALSGILLGGMQVFVPCQTGLDTTRRHDQTLKLDLRWCSH